MTWYGFQICEYEWILLDMGSKYVNIDKIWLDMVSKYVC